MRGPIVPQPTGLTTGGAGIWTRACPTPLLKGGPPPAPGRPRAGPATHQASLLGCSGGGFFRPLSLLSYCRGEEGRDVVKEKPRSISCMTSLNRSAGSSTAPLPQPTPQMFVQDQEVLQGEGPSPESWKGDCPPQGGLFTASPRPSPTPEDSSGVDTCSYSPQNVQPAPHIPPHPCRHMRPHPLNEKQK